MPITDLFDDDVDPSLEDEDSKAWSLDELDRSADLGSLQSAWVDALAS